MALSQLATGNPGWDAVIAVLAYSLVHLGIDDHSAAEQAATALTSEAVLAVRNGALPSATQAMGQVGELVGALQAPPAAAPPA